MASSGARRRRRLGAAGRLGRLHVAQVLLLARVDEPGSLLDESLGPPDGAARDTNATSLELERHQDLRVRTDAGRLEGGASDRREDSTVAPVEGGFKEKAPRSTVECDDAHRPG
jgi:hypothetical protein